MSGVTCLEVVGIGAAWRRFGERLKLWTIHCSISKTEPVDSADYAEQHAGQIGYLLASTNPGDRGTAGRIRQLLRPGMV